MLWAIAVILIILWALGLVSSYTMGGFVLGRHRPIPDLLPSLLYCGWQLVHVLQKK